MPRDRVVGLASRPVKGCERGAESVADSVQVDAFLGIQTACVAFHRALQVLKVHTTPSPLN